MGVRTVEVQISIDELVIEGFDSLSAQRFRRDFERELERLVESGSLIGTFDAERLSGGAEFESLELAQPTSPNELAVRVAQTLYQRLAQ